MTSWTDMFWEKQIVTMQRCSSVEHLLLHPLSLLQTTHIHKPTQGWSAWIKCMSRSYISIAHGPCGASSSNPKEGVEKWFKNWFSIYTFLAIQESVNSGFSFIYTEEISYFRNRAHPLSECMYLKRIMKIFFSALENIGSSTQMKHSHHQDWFLPRRSWSKHQVCQSVT